MSMLMSEDFQYVLRILNTNVDGRQKVMYAMCTIKGIGRRLSNLICKKADIDINKRAGELTNDEVDRIITIVQHPRQFKIPDWFLNRQKDVKDGKFSQVIQLPPQLPSNSVWLEGFCADWAGRCPRPRAGSRSPSLCVYLCLCLALLPSVTRAGGRACSRAGCVLWPTAAADWPGLLPFVPIGGAMRACRCVLDRVPYAFELCCRVLGGGGGSDERRRAGVTVCGVCAVVARLVVGG